MMKNLRRKTTHQRYGIKNTRAKDKASACLHLLSFGHRPTQIRVLLYAILLVVRTFYLQHSESSAFFRKSLSSHGVMLHQSQTTTASAGGSIFSKSGPVSRDKLKVLNRNMERIWSDTSPAI